MLVVKELVGEARESCAGGKNLARARHGDRCQCGRATTGKNDKEATLVVVIVSLQKSHICGFIGVILQVPRGWIMSAC